MEQQLRQVLLQRLESLRYAGVLDLPRAARGTSSSQIAAARPAEGAATGLGADTEADGAVAATSMAVIPSAASSLVTTDDAMAKRTALSYDQRVAALDRVCRKVAGCRRCEELAATRTQTVFGVGHPLARLVFLGEAPGADEDRLGEPFVGRAGQLLNKILEACSLRREDVYILNILKCRPPGNRAPLPGEAANCREYLMRQLEIIRPEYLCCLGATAVHNLLEITTPIGQLRQRFHQFQDIKVMATYHPAYLLRNPDAKRATWDDMKMLLADMGLELPQH